MTFRANGVIFRNFPVSREDFAEFVRTEILEAENPTQQAVVIFPGKDHDVLVRISTPALLQNHLDKGHEIVINNIIEPLVE